MVALITARGINDFVENEDVRDQVTEFVRHLIETWRIDTKTGEEVPWRVIGERFGKPHATFHNIWKGKARVGAEIEHVLAEKLYSGSIDKLRAAARTWALERPEPKVEKTARYAPVVRVVRAAQRAGIDVPEEVELRMLGRAASLPNVDEAEAERWLKEELGAATSERKGRIPVGVRAADVEDDEPPAAKRKRRRMEPQPTVKKRRSGITESVRGAALRSVSND